MNLCKTCGTICPFDDEHLECDNYTPLTNEGWLRRATTEQLAEFLNLIIRVGPYENEPKDFWEHVYGRGGEHGAKSIVAWLKQPHNSPK